MRRAPKKFEDPDSGDPHEVVPDPYRELFSDCESAEDIIELQREIEEAEAEEE